ncbi:hypothetical protein BGZ80_003384, partial [Entomortierella chlamydospora]
QQQHRHYPQYVQHLLKDSPIPPIPALEGPSNLSARLSATQTSLQVALPRKPKLMRPKRLPKQRFIPKESDALLKIRLKQRSNLVLATDPWRLAVKATGQGDRSGRQGPWRN